MILRLIVCICIVIFCIWQGILAASIPSESGRYYIPGVYLCCVILLISGLNRYGIYTWPLTTVLLLFREHFIIGWIPLFLVIFNLIGNELVKKGVIGSKLFGLQFFYKGRRQKIQMAGDMDDFVFIFVRYCKDYLIERCNFSKEKAQILVLDPELGPEMDKAIHDWICNNLGAGTDLDTFLISRIFDAPEMENINSVLKRYASGFSEKEREIKDYLKSIGHPLGSS